VTSYATGGPGSNQYGTKPKKPKIDDVLVGTGADVIGEQSGMDDSVPAMSPSRAARKDAKARTEAAHRHLSKPLTTPTAAAAIEHLEAATTATMAARDARGGYVDTDAVATMLAPLGPKVAMTPDDHWANANQSAHHATTLLAGQSALTEQDKTDRLAAAEALLLDATAAAAQARAHAAAAAGAAADQASADAAQLAAPPVSSPQTKPMSPARAGRKQAQTHLDLAAEHLAGNVPANERPDRAFEALADLDDAAERLKAARVHLSYTPTSGALQPPAPAGQTGGLSPDEQWTDARRLIGAAQQRLRGRSGLTDQAKADGIVAAQTYLDRARDRLAVIADHH
jgi:hypothetical protein